MSFRQKLFGKVNESAYRRHGNCVEWPTANFIGQRTHDAIYAQAWKVLQMRQSRLIGEKVNG